MADSNEQLTQEIMDTAKKLGELIAKHPALQKMADAQKAVTEDPEAGRLLMEFDQRLAVVSRNEQMGQPVSATERQELENLQRRLAGNLKIEAFSIAQVDLTDLLRKVSQTWQRPVAEAQQAAGGGDQGDAPQGGPGGMGGMGLQV